MVVHTRVTSSSVGDHWLSLLLSVDQSSSSKVVLLLTKPNRSKRISSKYVELLPDGVKTLKYRDYVILCYY